jgi:hypothetical protein
MNRDEQQTIRQVATAGADALERWRASKRVLRASRYRQRMEQVKESMPTIFLAAIERDDRRDERELEERAA